MGLKKYREKGSFPGKIVMVGFGSIGQGLLPLLLPYFDVSKQLVIINPSLAEKSIADAYGIPYHTHFILPETYKTFLSSFLSAGDFLVNLSVDVSSYALIELCQELGCLYLDTCIEPWKGGYTDPSLPAHARSNYAMREHILKLKKEKASTAVVTHGANPGLVSHFVKKALIHLAQDMDLHAEQPQTKAQWAGLAHQLGIKSIHIAERDWQISSVPKAAGEFVNTWSIDGFHGEGCQPAELGWGSHEHHWPAFAERHDHGCQAAIYLRQPGLETKVKSWTPLNGPITGFLVTHGESISLADYFTVKREDKSVLYRPTVHYSYHPCDDAVLSIHELAGRDLQLQETKRLLRDDISDGSDELGVLLMGHAKGAYWYGSQLTIHEARELAPLNSATTLQVTAAVLAGIIWAIENPTRGLVEPEDMDFDRILEIAMPYLGNVEGFYTNWTPLQSQHGLFNRVRDEKDPWQFINFLI